VILIYCPGDTGNALEMALEYNGVLEFAGRRSNMLPFSVLAYWWTRK
jgi:hypothetical protein